MKKVLISLCVLCVLLCGTATLTACGEDEVPRYTVTLDANGGECAAEEYVVQAGEAYSLPVPEKAGYEFLGWYEGETARTDRYGRAAARYDYAENKTFRAEWKPAEFAAVLNADGGRVSAVFVPVVYGENFSLPVPEREGYTFAGWYDAETPVTDGAGQSSAAWNFARNKELRAKWTASEYTVTLDANGGECAAKTSAVYGESITLPVPERAGYAFTGWYYNALPVSDETGRGEEWTFAKDVVLTARWEREITLNYIVDGQIVHTESYTQSRPVEELYEYQPAEGRTFNGWFADAAFTQETSGSYGLVVSSGAASVYGATYDGSAGLVFRENEYGHYSVTGYVGEGGVVTLPTTFNGGTVDKHEQFCLATGNVTGIVAPFMGTGGFSEESGPSEEYQRTSTVEYLVGTHCDKVKSVEITGEISVWSGTFGGGCIALESVELPCAVFIVSDVFDFCPSLKTFTVGKNVKNISGGAFAGAPALETLTVDAENPLYRAEGNCVLNAEGTRLVAACRTSVFPQGVSEIGSYAYSGADWLTEIEIPESVVRIANGAFSSCANLHTVVLPAGLEEIGWSAFLNCPSLTDISLPAGVSIGSGAFQSSGLKSLTLPENVSVQVFAFADCQNLKEVTIFAGCSMDPTAFVDCRNLEKITMPAGTEFVYISGNTGAFKGCVNLKEVDFGGTSEEWLQYRLHGVSFYLPEGCLIVCTDKTLVTVNNGQGEIDWADKE